MDPRPLYCKVRETSAACLHGCDCFATYYHMQPYYTQPRGCICPPTSEQTCQSTTCPRKP